MASSSRKLGLGQMQESSVRRLYSVVLQNVHNGACLAYTLQPDSTCLARVRRYYLMYLTGFAHSYPSKLGNAPCLKWFRKAERTISVCTRRTWHLPISIVPTLFGALILVVLFQLFKVSLLQVTLAAVDACKDPADDMKMISVLAKIGAGCA
ncbi:hypothetical protein B0I35DRAFT_405271 [Stachybotrys elegans]|uniref:Uncharacterized protein n=1 Tax=Stachybotrys elegans TaxID=80388 RepID=A0A8K0T3Q6_9HYPO|nr:hypothetical protein B0I35DRAFT_405271 [Stachybotrys elegans]